jgi:hypothetical protein
MTRGALSQLDWIVGQIFQKRSPTADILCTVIVIQRLRRAAFKPSDLGSEYFLNLIGLVKVNVVN